MAEIGVAALDSFAMRTRHAKIGVAENSICAWNIACFLERIEGSGRQETTGDSSHHLVYSTLVAQGFSFPVTSHAVYGAVSAVIKIPG